MELLFRVNDETKLGKVIVEMMQSAIKQDKKAVQIVEDDFMDKLIFPGKPLTEEQLDKVTAAMESMEDYIPLEQAQRETMAFIKKRRNESGNKKKG
jgi:hypothetical protein